MSDTDNKNDNNVDEILTKISSIDDARLKRLHSKGQYFALLERFEVLRLKFVYEPESLTKDEAINFVTLCKYFIQNGHSEPMRLSAHYIYKKYIQGKGLD